jgi:hypothetical protein
MQTMQTFYTQLSRGSERHNPYFQGLAQLCQLSRSKVASLKSVLYWNGWHAETA